MKGMAIILIDLTNRTNEQVAEQWKFINDLKIEFELSNKAICSDFMEEITNIQNQGCSLMNLMNIAKEYKSKIRSIIDQKNKYKNEIMTAFGVLYLTYGAYKKMN